MSGMDASSFHKIRSLKDVLTSLIKGDAPRRTHLPLQQVLTPALMTLINEAESTHADLRPALQAFSADLEQWQKFLAELQDTTNRWYIFQSREWTFSEGWWKERFAELHKVFASDPQQGARQWVQIFTQALVEWDLEGCKTLVEEPFPFPDYLAYLPLMFEGCVEALLEGNLVEAEDMVAFLVQPGGIDPDRPTLEPVLHALILVLNGRIEAQKENPEGVEDFFQKAIDLSPEDGRPRAAMGEHHRIKGELDQAAAVFSEAVRLSPDQPEGYIGMAMVMEDQEYWEEAHAWYRQAVDCALRFPDPYRTLTRLLAPVSGNLYYHLALALKDISERWALPAIENALELSIGGSLSYPEVDAYALQARLLKKLRKKAQAALAYYEAGRRSGWNLDYEQAVKLLQQARKLDPLHQPTYWYLSDDLRMLAVAAQELASKDALIQDSLKMWQEGTALGEINPDNSWCLFTRALINELIPSRRTTLPEEMVLYDWEAVLFVERNLLFSDDKSYQWSYLARFYRSLNLNANNQYVLDRALELDPKDAAAREEKIIRLTNRGDYPEAIDLIKPLLDDESYAEINWARSVYGYILSRMGQPEEGIRLSEYNLSELWVKLYRALCYMKLDQRPQAKAIYEEIWDSRTDQNLGNLLFYTIAGLHLALMDAEYLPALDQALEYARLMQNSPNDPFESYLNLGLVLLAKGESIQEAQQILESTALKATTRRELTDSINEVIPVMKTLMVTLPHGAQAIEILDNAIRNMQARVDDVYESQPTPESELLDNLEWLENSPHPGMPAEVVTNARLGARSSLARLYMNSARWGEAAQSYHALLTYETLIPEARLGLEKALSSMQQTSETYLQQDEFQAALPLLEFQAEFAQHLGNEQELPDISCKLAYAHLSLAGEQPESSLPQAASLLQQAGEHFRAQNREDVWIAISECLSKSLRSIADYWRVDGSLGMLISATVAEDAQLQSGLQQLRQSLDNYLGGIYKLNSPYIGNPVANRIAIELGSGLLPSGISQDWDLMHWVSYLHWYFHDTFGVTIPGVHIRMESESLAPDEFRILIDGQQVARRRVEDGLVPEQVVYLNLLSALQYNLERFMSVQAVSLLLQEWQKINASYFLAASRLLQDNPSLLVFQRVMQELAGEMVPTNKPDEILSTLANVQLLQSNLPDVVARLRIALQPYLPGNTREARRGPVPADIEDELKRYMQVMDGQAFLVLPNAARERIVSAIQGLLLQDRTPSSTDPAVEADSGPTVLVCQDASLRPLLRRLIAADLPYLPVLSTPEVLTEFPAEDEPADPQQPAPDTPIEVSGGDYDL